ncbi:outer membrane beta-barrel protein [Marinihelvus fidelis]|uniref:outer membrane beta-barrel protein n=1 Tax=Marinihelvus fidelis TaxID=2613842 RepID=UPI00177B8402|nr:outer membrane beta-barrel protein [Marinihelvus fidelis]
MLISACRHRWLWSLAGLLAVLVAPAASAQQYFDPGIMQRSIQQKPVDYQPVGARIGSFHLFPGVDLGWEHNDNVFYLPEDELDDDILHVRPWANLVSNWNRHALNASASADFASYSDYGANDYEDWTTQLDGRIDVRRDDWFSYDAQWMHLHEDRRSPDARFGVEPTVFDYGGYGAGYDHVFNRLKLGVYYNHSFFDYDNNRTIDGDVIDNQDRNREQDRLTLRGDWQLGPETAIFATWGMNDIDYDQPLDDNGYHRDSSGTGVSVGVAWDMTDLLTGDLSLGWSEQDYDDPRLQDVDGLNLGAGLTWTPRQTTLVNVRFAGGPQETTQPGTSGYFSQLYSVRVQQEVMPNFLLHLRGSWTTNNYENPGMSDTELEDTDVTRWGLGASYLFNRNLSLTVGYTRESQDANLGTFDYDTNRYFLNLGVEL